MIRRFAIALAVVGVWAVLIRTFVPASFYPSTALMILAAAIWLWRSWRA